MKIAIGCDHGGFILKDAVIKELDILSKTTPIEYKDFGTFDEKSVDYPDYALAVAEAVAKGEFDKGILLCGTGIGISIAANKIRGIRAAVCSDIFTAKACSAHNNANILCMGGRVINERLAEEMVKAWLETPFEGGRHIARLNKIQEIENKYMKMN